MKHNGWDHALKVTADGAGLVGHAGAVLLRKAADQAGLTAGLGAALRKKGASPLLDRGVVLVEMAAAIALGATSMSDIAVLAHLAPVLGDAPSGPTVRRALDLAGTPAMLDRIARARAKARAHVWDLIAGAPAGFPWLAIAGKTLTGWLVIDLDATLVTASSAKEGAAPTWKMGYGFHPLGAWCASTRECLDMLLRPGNAGSNTFTDHKQVLAAAIRQVPARFRKQVLVRVDGAGASHELVKHLLSLSSPRRIVLFTCGWMITAADEDAIGQVPAAAWKPGTGQDGTIEEDKDVAEITGLMSRAGNWPEGLRWIARRVKPSRRHLRNLTDYEKKTGWKYSITCTNIPDTGIGGVPGSHHPQYIDVLHREHAVVETGGVRTAKCMGLRNLPSKTWQVNRGWVIAANIAADLTAWTRLLGFCDEPDLRDADPDTLRYRVWHIPARLARHARERILKISPGWPWKDAFLACWRRLCALPAPA
jgi:Transposase DDE domain group 1